MQNKSRNWTDVQLIISSISVAVTLGFWGVMASRDKATAGVKGEVALPSDANAGMPASEVLSPGQVLYLSGQPPATPAPVTSQQLRKHRKGGGDGGGGAVASTGSS